jgi:thiamine-phosphate pyrophosphorylase
MEARQQSWPRAWLMTDERMGDRLWEAIGRLPRGAGIVFRHYSLAPIQREVLAIRISGWARERGITLGIAGDVGLAERLGAELVHNPSMTAGKMPFSRSAHDIDEADAARREGASLVFVSPVYATRSHPGQDPLGPEFAGRIARTAGVPAIALGGVDQQKFTLLERQGFFGWAGIDAWLSAKT